MTMDPGALAPVPGYQPGMPFNSQSPTGISAPIGPPAPPAAPPPSASPGWFDNLRAEAKAGKQASEAADPYFWGKGAMANAKIDAPITLNAPGPAGSGPAAAGAEAGAAAPTAGVPNPFAAKAGASAAGGGAPTDYHKLGMVASGQSGKEYETDKLIADRAHEQEMVEGGRLADLQARQQAAHADASAIAIDHYQAGMAAAARDRAAHEAETKALNDKIESARDDLSKDKIDPDHIYGEHKTLGKILSGIGLAMGAYGASMGHHENFSQTYIQNAIKDDIDAQKANHATKAEGVKGMINLYDRHRQEGLDHQGAEQATHADLLHTAIMMGDAQADKAQSPIMLQNWQKTRAALLAQQADVEQGRTVSTNKLGWDTAKAQAAASAAAAQSRAEALAKTDLDNAETASAVDRIKSTPEGELAGYGTGGRIRHWIADKTGLDVESDEAKANHRAVEKLESRDLKDSGSRVNPETLEHVGKNVRDEADVRALAGERIRKALLERKQDKQGVRKGEKAAPAALQID